MTNATIGHNNPPTDADILKDYLKSNNSELLEEAENIGLEMEFLPNPVKTDEAAIKVTEFIKRVNDCNKKMESAREENKAPYFQAGKTVDAFFKEYKTKLDSVAADLKKPLLVFQQEKATEAARLAKIEEDRLKKEAAEKLVEATVQEALGSSIASDLLDDAIKAEKQAEKAGNVVGLGAVKSATASSGIRKRMVGELESLDKLDIVKLKKFFTEADIKKAINAMVASGIHECAGVKIYEKQEVVVR